MKDNVSQQNAVISQPFVNRKYKDSIFVDLLTSKEENIRQVCEALGESVRHENIEILRLDNTVYTGLQNDVSCLIGQRLMMLIEHQSTPNPNMPMRCLQYAGRLYESIVPKEDRYSTCLKAYPNAECYTFYNGDAPYPEYSELRLSDLFIDKSRPPSIELIVKVLNINYSENNNFLKKCPILNDYAIFVQRVKENRGEGAKGYEKAVRSCMKDGILKEYLDMKTRVINSMLVSEYDAELHMKVRLEEAAKQGIQQGIATIAHMMKLNGYDIQEIQKLSGLSKEEVERL